MIVPYRWYWRLVWSSGHVAATSGGVAIKASAEANAHRVADAIGVPVIVVTPCVI